MSDTATIFGAAIRGEIGAVQEVQGIVSMTMPVTGTICVGSMKAADRYPAYEGEYSVVPSMDAQVLPTRRRSVDNDIVVAGVPAYRVSNDFGETFTIG